MTLERLIGQFQAYVEYPDTYMLIGNRECRDILKYLTELPKTGHWIEEFNDLEGEVRFTCSSCGKYQLFGTDYCYNCGAKMTESEVKE